MASNDDTRAAPVVAQHDEDKPDEAEAEIHFEPVVKLEKVDVASLEEEETPLYKMRAKLFRYDPVETQWKERGIGDMRMMMHNKTGKVRLLMRREKTLKICVNHYITPEMRLQPNAYSDRALSWSANADFSEGEVKSEVLAIRFKEAELSQRFNERFEEMRAWNEALSSGSVQPGDASCPKADANAAEGPAEAGSEKKRKEDAAAATGFVATSEEAGKATTAPSAQATNAESVVVVAPVAPVVLATGDTVPVTESTSRIVEPTPALVETGKPAAEATTVGVSEDVPLSKEATDASAQPSSSLTSSPATVQVSSTAAGDESSVAPSAVDPTKESSPADAAV